MLLWQQNRWHELICQRVKRVMVVVFNVMYPERYLAKKKKKTWFIFCFFNILAAGSTAGTSLCSGQDVRCSSFWFRLRWLVWRVDRALTSMMTSSEFSLISFINSDRCIIVTVAVVLNRLSYNISQSNYVGQLTAVTSRVRNVVVRLVGMVMCCFGEWRRTVQVEVQWVFLKKCPQHVVYTDVTATTGALTHLAGLHFSPFLIMNWFFAIFVIGHRSLPLWGVTLEVLCPFGSCHRL